MRVLLFLLPMIACAQTVVGPNGALVRADFHVHATESPKWSIVSITAPGFREAVRATSGAGEKNLGTILLSPGSIPGALGQVFTVCEALEKRDPLYFESVAIVGIFKSGLDETLRQDCPNQLVAGDVGFLSAIALTHPTDPPASLRAEIEKKRAIILASGPPGAHPRPERVVALYGRLVSPSGLASLPCCTAPVEINTAPARLVGPDEHDFRVLR